jgi:hypothetical protein
MFQMNELKLLDNIVVGDPLAVEGLGLQNAESLDFTLGALPHVPLA